MATHATVYRNAVPDLSQAPAAVILFVLAGCPACHAILPRFKAVAQKYAACLPVVIMDATRDDYGPVADYFGVTHTPTAIGLTRKRGQVARFHGAVADHEIERLFQTTVYGLSCELQGR